MAFDGACGHYGRHIAAKSHDERDERLAVKPHFVHEFVHDEGGACHISTVFHEGNEEVEDENLRQEDDYGPHTAYHSVYKHVFDRAIGQLLAQHFAQCGHAVVYPVHGHLPQYERSREHHEEQEDEDGEPKEAVGDDTVDEMGHLIGVFLVAGVIVSFFQCTVDEAIFGVHDGCFTVVASLFHYAFGCRVAMVEYFFGVCHLLYIGFHVAIAFQQFDGKVTGGVALSQIGLEFQVLLYLADAVFNFVSVVDVDVAEVDFFVFCSLIELYDLVEELFHAHSRGERCGHHGHSEQFGQAVVVDVVATFFGLVKHVEGHYHAYVHVYELCGEVEVALQVAGVYDVDDDVWGLLDDLFAHVEFFWRVGAEAICAGKVYQIELVALEVGLPFLGVNGHARVVADAFVGARCKVEERCFAAIGVSHQCHIDDVMPLFGRFL